MNGEVQIRRLAPGDEELARETFATMADVFEENSADLGDGYLGDLLSREDFWAIAAVGADGVLGGLTAHTLPLTRAESSEIFIYDIAVRRSEQRKGIGRLLMTALLDAAAASGIHEVFVPADNDDAHALDFYRALGGVGSRVTFFTFSVRDQ